MSRLAPVWPCLVTLVMCTFIAASYLAPTLKIFQLSHLSPWDVWGTRPGFQMFRYATTVVVEIYFLTQVTDHPGFKAKWALAWLGFSVALAAIV